MATLDVGLFVRVNGQKASPSSAPKLLRIIAVEKGFQLAIVMPMPLLQQESEVSNSEQYFERD
jgi:hypothetical protein